MSQFWAGSADLFCWEGIVLISERELFSPPLFDAGLILLVSRLWLDGPDLSAELDIYCPGPLLMAGTVVIWWGQYGPGLGFSWVFSLSLGSGCDIFLISRLRLGDISLISWLRRGYCAGLLVEVGKLSSSFDCGWDTFLIFWIRLEYCPHFLTGDI